MTFHFSVVLENNHSLPKLRMSGKLMLCHSIIMTLFFFRHIRPLRPFNVKKTLIEFLNDVGLISEGGMRVLSVCAHSLCHVFFLCLKSIQGRSLLDFCLITGYDGSVVGGQQLREDDWNGITLKIRIIKPVRMHKRWIPGGTFSSWQSAGLV